MSKNSKIIKLLSTDEFDRVDIFLKKNIAELSRSRLNQLIRDNCVSINDKKNISVWRIILYFNMTAQINILR